MSEKLRVSVVTPSFNQAAFVEQTIKSVLDQDYPHIEYIVIDGGSTDGTVEVIRRYGDRLAYWVSEKDGGQSDAIVKGFARASGDVFVWVNSDDWLMPGAVAEAVKVLESDPAAACVAAGAVIRHADGRDEERRYQPECVTHRDLLADNARLTQPSVFMRAAAYRACGGVDASLHYCMDADLWLRLSRSGHVCITDGVWSGITEHADAKSCAGRHYVALRVETLCMQLRWGMTAVVRAEVLRLLSHFRKMPFSPYRAVAKACGMKDASPERLADALCALFAADRGAFETHTRRLYEFYLWVKTAFVPSAGVTVFRAIKRLFPGAHA